MTMFICHVIMFVLYMTPFCMPLHLLCQYQEST